MVCIVEADKQSVLALEHVPAEHVPPEQGTTYASVTASYSDNADPFFAHTKAFICKSRRCTLRFTGISNGQLGDSHTTLWLVTFLGTMEEFHLYSSDAKMQR
jgi:hypothetical protein